MAYLKSSIKKVFNAMGFDIVKHDTTPPLTHIDKLSEVFDGIYRQIFKDSTEALTVFDVGAHRGESISRFKRMFGNATVHAFEPDRENFATIAEKFSGDKSVALNNCGIGNSNGTLKYFKYKKSDVGGFSKIDLDNTWTKIRSQQHDTTPEDFNTASYEVDIKRLDDYIEENGIKKVNILKMDTQGFEDEVLKGCEKALRNNVIDYIELELIITGPYERTLSFKDIEDVLHPYGYKLYGIQKGGNYFDKPILQFDLIFASSDCYIEGHYRQKIEQ